MTEPILTFIHLSDTHIHADPSYTGSFVDFSSRSSLASVIAQINALPFPIDFVLHTGDVMNDPERNEDYTIIQDLFSSLQIPVYYTVGNHDRPEGIKQVLFGNRVISAESKRLYYQFEAKGVQVVVLDGYLQGTAAGTLDDDQLRWLERICLDPSDQRPLIVALHQHPILIGTPWIDTIPLTNGETLHQILLGARHRVRGVFYGHIHEQICTVRDGIPYFSVLSCWFQTRTWHGQANPLNDPTHIPGFNLVTLSERDLWVRSYRVPIEQG